MKANLFLLALALTAGGCGKGPGKATSQTTNQNATGGNPLTAPVDYLGAVGKAKKSVSARIDTLSLSQAIQMFHAQEDRYPKDLNELVTERYLPAIPKAPAGTRLLYNPETGQVKYVRQ